MRLTTGRYELLAEVAQNTVRPSADRDHEPSPVETVLLDLLQFPGDESDVIWIDDRWATSLEHRDSMRIVGTLDVLAMMKEAGTISAEEVDHVLMEMRSADVRFIAFDSDELLRALLDAPVENGTVVETKALRVFRQYYARCLLEADALRPPIPGANAPTEWNFLLRCGLAITAALIEVWETPPIEHAAAKADWLLRNLYVDDRGIHGTVAPRSEAADAYRASVSLVSLIAGSIRLDGNKASRRARREYLRWLYHRIVRTRFAADLELRRAAVDDLKRTITQSLEKDDETLQTVTTRLMGRLWSDLPREIRKVTDADQEFLKSIGVSMKAVTEIGPLRLERRPTWMALAQALRDSTPAEMATLDGHVVKVAIVQQQPPVFSLKCDAPEFEGHVGGDEFAFLSESVTERESSAARLMHWFDLPEQPRNELVARIVAGQDPGTRIELALEARARSGEALYRRVFDSIKEGDTFNPKDAMPLDSAVLVDHLRLDLSDPASSRWARSAERLLRELGVAGAATRLGGIPVRLPDAVIQSLSALKPRDRRRALRAIRKVLLASPVGVVQLADLWVRLPDLARHAATMRDRLVRLLCDEARRPVFDAWIATLQWFDEEFAFQDSFRDLPTDVRVGFVWAHADRLFRVLLARDLPPEWIRNVFERSQYVLPSHFIFPDDTYSDDVATPRRLRTESFVLAGLALIYGAERSTAGMQHLALTIERLDDESQARIFGSMLADMSSATDALGSWLGMTGERLELFPEEVRERFGQEAAVARVRAALAGIVAKTDETRNWLTVGATVGDCRPAESLANELESTLLNVDWIDYLGRDPMLAVTALGVLGSQARFLSTEGRGTIEMRLFEVVERIGDFPFESSMRDTLAHSILAALIGSAWSHASGETRAAALTKSLERLAESSVSVFTKSGPFVLRLCDALPTNQARHFWRVRELLRCRAQL